jgi:hypothetical protein
VIEEESSDFAAEWRGNKATLGGKQKDAKI